MSRPVHMKRDKHVTSMHVTERDIGAADLSPIRSEIRSAFSDSWKVKSRKAEPLDVQALHVREMIRH